MPHDTSPARVLLLTGDARRHRAAAARLAGTVRLCGVVQEPKRPVADASRQTPHERSVLDRHFAERDAVERRLLGEPAWPAVERLLAPPGLLNEPDVVHWIAARRPDAVVSFGCGVLRSPLLEAFAGRLVNLHLGLSPYYRGTATNFWALVDGRPECVGATLHETTAVLDGGPVLAQVRPVPRTTDRAHELGTGALLAALDALPAVLDAHLDGRLGWRGDAHHGAGAGAGAGRLCRRADFTAAAVERLWARLGEGLVAAYAADTVRRQAAVPIVAPAHGVAPAPRPTEAAAAAVAHAPRPRAVPTMLVEG